MTPLLTESFTIIIIFICCSCNDEIVELNVESDGRVTSKYPELSMTEKFDVQFENKSGFDCILYWINTRNGEYIKQSELDFPSLTTIGTFPNHTFVYTLKSNPKQILYQVTMSPYIDVITLLPKERMDKIDENEKLLFYKNYYLQSGKHWKNYYPRNPLIYPYLNITHIGQIINAYSLHTKYYKITNEMEQLLIFNNHTFNEELKQHKTSSVTHKKLKLQNIDHHEFEMDNYYVLTYNDTEYYRDKIDENRDKMEVKMEVLCTAPTAMRILNFLSDDECEHLIEMGLHSNMLRSTVGETKITNLARTSSHIWIHRDYSKIADNIINRIGDMVQIDGNVLHSNLSAEDLQLVHYKEGEYYQDHHDYGTDSENNRYITVLLYLNHVQYGGNTSFPMATKQCKNENNYFGVRPIKKSALIFYDMLKDTNVDILSKHYAEPPINGSHKWMTNLWIWDPYFHHVFSGYGN